MSEIYEYSMIILLSIIFTLACVNCWLEFYKIGKKKERGNG